MSAALVGVVWRSFAQSFRRDAQVGLAVAAGLGASVVVAAFVVGQAAIAADGGHSSQVGLAIVGVCALVAAFLIGELGHPGDAIDARAIVAAGRRPGGAAVDALLAALVAPRALVWWLAGLGAGLVSGSTAAGADGPALIGGAAFGASLIAVDRIGTAVGRALAARRAGREVRALIGYLLLIVAAPVVFTLVFLPWREVVADIDARLLDALVWVPPLDGLLAAHAERPWLAAGLAAGGALALLLGALAIAARNGRRMMRHVADGGATRLGVLRTATGSATRVIAWRITTAWLRDGRYAVVLVSVIVLPLLLLVPLAIGGVPREWLVLLPMPLFGFLLGWSLHNDIAYDSTAVWLHVTAGMRGTADRLGRIVPALLWGSVLIIAGGALSGAFAGAWIDAAATVIVSLALLWVSAGGSAIMSVAAPYPVAQPDDPPLTQPVRAWGGAVVAHPVAGLVEIALCLPVILLALDGLRTDSWSRIGAAAGGAVAVGALAIAIGVALGGRIFERRGTRILQFAQTQ